MTEESNIVKFNTKEELHAYTAEQCKPIPSQGVYESAELGKLFEALSKSQGEMEVAKEDAKNPFFKSKYADLASIIKSSRPYLSKHGLCVIQRIMANGNGTSYLFTRLSHASGQWMESRMNLLPTKPDMQGMGSAITYAKRYAYAALVGVVTGEDDDGNAACVSSNNRNSACVSSKEKETAKPVSITQSQAKTILEHITKANDDTLLDKVLEYYNINKLSYLPQALFKECLERVEKYGESR